MLLCQCQHLRRSRSLQCGLWSEVGVLWDQHVQVTFPSKCDLGRAQLWPVVNCCMLKLTGGGRCVWAGDADALLLSNANQIITCCNPVKVFVLLKYITSHESCAAVFCDWLYWSPDERSTYRPQKDISIEVHTGPNNCPVSGFIIKYISILLFNRMFFWK